MKKIKRIVLLVFTMLMVVGMIAPVGIVKASEGSKEVRGTYTMSTWGGCGKLYEKLNLGTNNIVESTYVLNCDFKYTLSDIVDIKFRQGDNCYSFSGEELALAYKRLSNSSKKDEYYGGYKYKDVYLNDKESLTFANFNCNSPLTISVVYSNKITDNINVEFSKDTEAPELAKDIVKLDKKSKEGYDSYYFNGYTSDGSPKYIIIADKYNHIKVTDLGGNKIKTTPITSLIGRPEYNRYFDVEGISTSNLDFGVICIEDSAGNKKTVSLRVNTSLLESDGLQSKSIISFDSMVNYDKAKSEIPDVDWDYIERYSLFDASKGISKLPDGYDYGGLCFYGWYDRNDVNFTNRITSIEPTDTFNDTFLVARMVTKKEYAELTKCKHDYTTEYKEPTCVDDGYVKNICKLCGDESTVTIPATGHKWGKVVVVKPTCKNKGYSKKVCKMCDKIETFDVKGKLKHNYVKSSKAPTYFANGYTKTECSVCKNVLSKKTYAKKVLGKVQLTEIVRKTNKVARISWKKVSNATGYKIYKLMPNNKYKLLRSTKSNSLLVAQKETSKCKYYIVAYKTNGKSTVYSKYKTKFNIVKGAAVPNKVAGVKAKSTGSGTIKVSWKSAPLVTRYEVQYSKNSNFKGAKTIKVSKKGLNKTISNLSGSTTFYVRVRGVRTIKGMTSNGDWSKPVAVNVYYIL